MATAKKVSPAGAANASSIINAAQNKANSITNTSYNNSNNLINSALQKILAANANANATATKGINYGKSQADAINQNASNQATNIANQANQQATGIINNAQDSTSKAIADAMAKAQAMQASNQAQNQALMDAYKNSSAYQNAQNLQNSTIDDIAKKYGFDFSKAYADQQAETAAQAQRNVYNAQQRTNDAEDKTNLQGILNNYNQAAGALDTNYFNQFAGQQQNLADRGLNAGIANQANLQLGMNKQKELGNLWNTRSLNTQQENMRYANQNQTISDALAQVEKQKALDAKNNYQTLLNQGYNILNSDRNSATNWANQNYGMTRDQMNENTANMNTGLNTLSNYTGMGVNSNQNYANMNVNNVNNNANRQLSNLQNTTGNSLNALNSYTTNNLNNLDRSTTNTINAYNTNLGDSLNNQQSYTNNQLNNNDNFAKMNVNNIYNSQQLAQQAANRAAQLKAASMYSPNLTSVGQNALQSALQSYQAAKPSVSAGGSVNTPLDKYYMQPSIGAMESAKKTMSPAISNAIGSPLPPALANTDPWSKMKMMGL